MTQPENQQPGQPDAADPQTASEAAAKPVAEEPTSPPAPSYEAPPAAPTAPTNPWQAPATPPSEAPTAPVYQAPQSPYAAPGGQPPVDPFQQTTNTPASAQLPPPVDPTQPLPVGTPVSSQPYSAQPYSGQPYSAQPHSGQPYSGQPYPGQSYPGQQYPGQPYPGAPLPPPKKKSKALLITGIVLGVLALLCAAGGVGAFFLLRGGEGKGAVTAKDAAQDFLTAVYKEGDAAEAEKLVCKEARDKAAIEAKVNEIETQKNGLKSPSITWGTPDIKNETEKSADTTVTLKLTTTDEKISEQTLKLQLVKRDGWFVCEVQEQTK